MQQIDKSMKSIESITVGSSRAESKESAKVESIDRVGQKLPWIDRLTQLDRFRATVAKHCINSNCLSRWIIIINVFLVTQQQNDLERHCEHNNSVRKLHRTLS